MNARSLGIAVLGVLVLGAIGLADNFCLFNRSFDQDFSVARFVSNEFAPDVQPLHFVADAEQEETMIDKKFAVKPGEMLEIQNVHSDVVVETGSGSEARVRVTLDGRNMDRARAFFDHLDFQVEKSGQTLSITTNPGRNWNGSSGNADVNVFVSIPEVFDADITTRHGDVVVGDMKGTLSFDVAHGDLDLGILSGSLLTIAAAHGDVDTKRLASEKVQMKVEHGDADVGEITSMVVEFVTHHGDVQIVDATASEIDVTTHHGDVSIGRLDGYPQISATHGDVDVHLANARGGAFVTNHGDIHLSASSSAGMDVDFAASDIEIDTPYQFQGRQQKDRIEGKINGGGEKLAAKSTYGHIRLQSSSNPR